MHRTTLAVAVLAVAISACATGPRRQPLPEFLSEPEPPALASAEGTNPAAQATPEEAAPAPASPFSAGLMLGAGMSLEGGALIPVQLAVGSLRVTEFRGQGLDLLALGGVSQTDVSRARLSWGVGLSYQLTPERFAYSVAAGGGMLWFQGEEGPAAIFGFALTPDM